MKQSIFFAMVASITINSACEKELSSEDNDNSVSTAETATSYYYQSGGSVTHNNKEWYSLISDTSGVHISNSGTYSLSNSRVWTSGNTSSTDNSSFYGLNAGILAYNASVTLNNDSVRTTGSGANGVFAYGTGTINMTADTIVCSGDYAHAIMVAGGGTISATDLVATTSGGSSSIIATDRGGGTITVNGGNYTTSGTNSASVYSTGTINVTGAVLTAKGAEAFVIEGANNATITNCITTCSFDKWGALVYQSFSGDADGTKGTLTINGGSFTYTGNSGGLFYNTNDTAYIYLNGVEITNSCDTLVRSVKGSWNGVAASSGGNTILICNGQIVTGLIYADQYSKASLTLSNGSAFTGRINPGNVAVNAAVEIDATSTWKLNGNTYLKSLTNSNTTNSNISANGYHLYVNGSLVL